MVEERNIDALRLDCALGCVIGAFIGDALGSALEFKSTITSELLAKALEMPGGIYNNAPGQVTDDSELAMCLLTALNETAPEFSLENIAKYYKCWINSRPFDIGSTIASALLPLREEEEDLANVAIRASEYFNIGSKSNGSLMRASPLAVFCRKLPVEDIIYIVSKEVSLTHSNQTIIQSECLYIIFLAHLIQNPHDKQGAWNKAMDYLNNCNDEVKQWIHDINNSPPMPGNPMMGFAKIAFDHSFRQVMKNGVNFETAMREILVIGGDTDSNAAIVGAIIGAYVGYRELPDNWKFKVERFNSLTMKGIRREGEFLNQTLVNEKVRSLFEKAPENIRHS